MKYTLLINVESESLTLSLLNKEKTEETIKKKTKGRSEQMLFFIKTLLEKHKAKIEDLAKIKIHFVSDSLTGKRVKSAIVNALGFSLNIPVVIKQ